MQKTRPTTARLAVMALFALSCFGLLLFLWKSFGRPVPLSARQYTLSADFREATQLADTADVRISGVRVGRVKKTEPVGRRTHVTMLIEPRYAPLPRNTRAILRQKTLLGETYVELTPGERASGPLPDGAELPTKQVQSTVEIDEVTRQLDAPTRRDLQRLVAGIAQATGGH